MRKSITISIPSGLDKEVTAAIKEEGMTRSDIVRESLSEFLYFRRLRKLRDEMSMKAQRSGIFTDEDVFNRVS